MKIIQINTFPHKATGSIMMNIHKALLKNNHDSYVVWGRGRKPENKFEISIEDKWGIRFHGVYTRLTDRTGFASKRATKILLHMMDEISPDIVHLHNVHGYYVNIEMLFEYLKKKQIKVIWTLHDCWGFTGHCVYFDAIGCDRWKEGCCNCPQKNTYPTSIWKDNSEWNWEKKKRLFQGLDMVIVSPSKWLAHLAKESFLNQYKIEVIHNGINTNVYTPSNSKHTRNKYKLEQKIMILGVASEWTERKGLMDFIKLEKGLHACMPERYQIILVGVNKKQLHSIISPSIVAKERTSNVQELVDLYSAADILFNPTYEDNYPTTNLESICCGTPVITYRTGGSVECINTNTGFVVERGDIRGAIDIIQKNKKPKLGITIEVDVQKKEKGMDRMIDEYRCIYKG